MARKISKKRNNKVPKPNYDIADIIQDSVAAMLPSPEDIGEDISQDESIALFLQGIYVAIEAWNMAALPNDLAEQYFTDMASDFLEENTLEEWEHIKLITSNLSNHFRKTYPNSDFCITDFDYSLEEDNPLLTFELYPTPALIEDFCSEE